MFNDMEELLAEIEKFKNNIIGIDSIAESLKRIYMDHETQNKRLIELVEEARVENKKHSRIIISLIALIGVLIIIGLIL